MIFPFRTLPILSPPIGVYSSPGEHWKPPLLYRTSNNTKFFGARPERLRTLIVRWRFRPALMRQPQLFRLMIRRLLPLQERLILTASSYRTPEKLRRL